MNSAWLLPEHFADVLPAEARRIETLRRRLLDAAERSGFELVIPPMLEHVESLLTGTGRELDLQTFKLVDQLSGRLLGVRADTTPQVARIDAHLLNRQGVTRLCYCGPVLHTRASGWLGSRELMQFGAEIYGHPGLEADTETQEFALAALRAAGVRRILIDLGDARVLRGVLAGVPMDGEALEPVVQALAAKDAAGVHALTERFPAAARDGLRALLDLYGSAEVLERAHAVLPARPLIHQALDELRQHAEHLRREEADVSIGFDLCDLSGYAYYSGTRFAVFGDGAPGALARGGRYDQIGAVFGRNRPAVGFSLDLKALAAIGTAAPPRPAIRAPWDDSDGLRSAIARLREAGDTVVRLPPGPADAAQDHVFDRQLVRERDGWAVRPL